MQSISCPDKWLFEFYISLHVHTVIIYDAFSLCLLLPYFMMRKTSWDFVYFMPYIIVHFMPYIIVYYFNLLSFTDMKRTRFTHTLVKWWSLWTLIRLSISITRVMWNNTGAENSMRDPRTYSPLPTVRIKPWRESRGTHV